MLKLFFWLLLLANGVLFAFHQGYLGSAAGEPREAGRLAQQLHADKIRLLDERAAKAAATPLFASAAPAVHTTPAACVEIGDFGAAEGQRFAARLAALGLQPKSSARSMNDAGGEGAGYMVYIPPPGERAALDKKLAELRQLDIKDFFVLPQSATPPGGISLGVFKTEEGARAQLANLSRKGVRGARIQARGAGKQAFLLRGLDADEQAALQRLGAEFPDQQVRPCDAPVAGHQVG